MNDKVVKLMCGIAGFLFGKIDGLLIALLTVIVIDYSTGPVCAKINKNLSSAVGFKGLAKAEKFSRQVIMWKFMQTQTGSQNDLTLNDLKALTNGLHTGFPFRNRKMNLVDFGSMA